MEVWIGEEVSSMEGKGSEAESRQPQDLQGC